MGKTLNEWAEAVWQNAEDHGFHNPGANDNVAAWCANLHGEVSELWEAHRNGKLSEPCDKPIPITCAEEELGDIIIRALDTARQLSIDVEKVVQIKHEYNKSRPYLHGKKA